MTTIISIAVLAVVVVVWWDMWGQGLWNHQRRMIDKQILLPACVEEARRAGMGIEEAANAFLAHAVQDPAWQDITPPEAIDLINEWIVEEWNK